MGNDSLPREIVFDILTRLPVKSICRFKCVSKSWLSTISTPKFVDSHFNRSRSPPKLLISVWTSGEAFSSCKEYPQNLFIAEQEERGPLVLGHHQATLPVKESDISDPITLAGLTLSIGSPDLIVITNPITKASVAFPRAFPKQVGCDCERSIRFGFDPVDGEHKIVECQVLCVREFNLLLSPERVEYRVVSVSDSGNWRSIQGPVVRYITAHDDVCVDGVIYSEATTKMEARTIVAFDVRSEKFQVVKLSINGRLSNPHNPYRYIELEGKLAIVDYPYSNKIGEVEEVVPVSALDLWVMEDFENQVWSFKSASGLIPWSFALTRQLIGTTIDGDQLIFADFREKDEPFVLPVTLPDDIHYTRTIEFYEGEDVMFSLYFLNVKTGDFWRRQVRLPPEYPLTGKVRISAATLVERL